MKSIVSIFLAAVLVYLMILLLMFLFQNRLLFMPSSGIIAEPGHAGLQAEDLWIDTSDGLRLHSWYFPNDETEFVVVLSHGNAGNISGRIAIAETLIRSGASVLMYDYRGYGRSGGRPSEKGFYRDIEAVTKALMSEKGYSEKQIVMYGRSLGGAVAAYAATRFAVGGLVLDSAFLNLREMVRDVYPFVPSRLARYEFPTDQYLSRIHEVPVMIIHSRQDEIVPFRHAERLYEMTGEPRKFTETAGGHNHHFFTSRELIEQSWREYLQGL
ncbi:MAG: alpha/beta hydrolase [Balneolaceae bacterium]|nr:MAG: alpha/beta hydrolase [Balneolaceae bacterium]